MKAHDDTFFRMSRDFINTYLPRQRKLSPNTVKSYKITLNQFLDYLIDVKGRPIAGIVLDDVNRENVSGFLDWLQAEKGSAPATRNQKLMAIRSFAKYCSITGIENIYLRLDVCKVPVQKAVGGRVEFMSENAMETLLATPDMKNHYGLRNGFFMILLYDTAARCQEMLDLRIRDFVIKKEPGSSFVYLTGKGDKTRAVPLMDKTVGHLQQYLKFFHPEASRSPDDYLFYTVIHGARNQMSPDTVAYFIHKYAVKAHKENPDVPVKAHPHMFRHTRAVHLYRSGYPLSLLSEYLGHEQDSTTRIYAQASVDMKAEALCKASNPENIPDPSSGLWEGDRETIKKLYGLK